MQVDDTIVLDDNQRYTLLQSVEVDDNTYFLAIGIDEQDNPDYKNMVILKECQDIDGIYVETVANEALLGKLTKMFEKKLKEVDEK